MDVRPKDLLDVAIALLGAIPSLPGLIALYRKSRTKPPKTSRKRIGRRKQR